MEEKFDLDEEVEEFAHWVSHNLDQDETKTKGKIRRLFEKYYEAGMKEGVGLALDAVNDELHTHGIYSRLMKKINRGRY